LIKIEEKLLFQDGGSNISRKMILFDNQQIRINKFPKISHAPKVQEGINHWRKFASLYKSETILWNK